MMNRKDFVALADSLRDLAYDGLLPVAVEAAIIKFCKSQNPSFDTERWIEYLHNTDK